MASLAAFAAGLLFGAGLLISGMADPQRVLGFLDVAGQWNPALAFTMIGAIAVAAPAYWFVRRRGATALGEAVVLPDRFKIDAALLGGSALFGVGWGLSGICPGPALLLLTGGSLQAAVFAGSMVAGFFVLSALRPQPAVRPDAAHKPPVAR
jgi:uncharacterized membrane protein YedE/YeeE